MDNETPIPNLQEKRFFELQQKLLIDGELIGPEAQEYSDLATLLGMVIRVNKLVQ